MIQNRIREIAHIYNSHISYCKIDKYYGVSKCILYSLSFCPYTSSYIVVSISNIYITIT